MAEPSTRRHIDSKLVGWGIDDPVLIMGLVTAGTVGVLIGFLIDHFATNLTPEASRGVLIAGGVVGAGLIAFAAALSLRSSVTKLTEAVVVTRILPFGGSELVLDVGCGRGALSVVIAKKLTTGLVISLDVWDPWHITGNSPQSLLANAENVGVGERVAGIKAIGAAIPFPDMKFDVVASCLGLQHEGNFDEFDNSVKDMVRVLKEGGRFTVLCSGYGGRLTKLLASLGMTEIRASRVRAGIIPLAQRISARKSFVQPA